MTMGPSGPGANARCGYVSVISPCHTRGSTSMSPKVSFFPSASICWMPLGVQFPKAPAAGSRMEEVPLHLGMRTAIGKLEGQN